MITFLGTNRTLKDSDFIRSAQDTTEHLDDSTIVFLADNYKSNLTDEQLSDISNKLVYISDEEKTDVTFFRKFSKNDFANLTDDILIDLMTLLEYKETNFSLENNLAIQEVLHDELLYKQEEFDATKEIALLLSSDEPFEKRIATISKVILDFFKVNSGVFLLKQDLYFNQAFHSFNAKCKPFIAVKGSLINWVEKNKMPLFVKNLAEDLRFQVQQEINYPNLPVLAQPIIGNHEHFIGIFFLFCDNLESSFNSDDIEKINTFFEVISPLIENAIMKKELEHMYQVKSHFLANMTHELRTPLNGIIGFADILMMDELNDEQTDYIQTIKGSGEHLLSLINNILDITKLEANEFTLEYLEVDINKIFKDCVNSMIPKAREKNIEVKVEELKNLPESAFGDPVKIKQILLNLLSNSIKFTEEGGVYFTAFTKNEEHNKYTISVDIRDTGCGIPQSKIKEIFEPFKQADDSMARKHEGTGLGLSISQKLIKLHGGEKINVKSEENIGSTFTFALDLFKANPQEAK